MLQVIRIFIYIFFQLRYVIRIACIFVKPLTQIHHFHSHYRYDPTTGFFTVPSGHGGLYHFITYTDTDDGQSGSFSLAKFPRNDLCIVDGDNTNNNLDHDSQSCAVTTYLNPGETIN